jgi:hypothetical protein
MMVIGVFEMIEGRLEAGSGRPWTPGEVCERNSRQ